MKDIFNRNIVQKLAREPFKGFSTSLVRVTSHTTASSQQNSCRICKYDFGPVLYASTRVTFHFILCHSRHLFVAPVMFPSFPSLLRHHRLFVLLTVHYRLLSSPRLSSFVYSFVTDLFRPFFVPSIISRICGYAIIL